MSDMSSTTENSPLVHRMGDHYTTRGNDPCGGGPDTLSRPRPGSPAPLPPPPPPPPPPAPPRPGPSRRSTQAIYAAVRLLLRGGASDGQGREGRRGYPQDRHSDRVGGV